MTVPLVTICIPTYNYAQKVTRAIHSVMGQTVSNFECIVIDDGSTDDTEKVVKEFIARDNRFRYIKKDNEGVAVARNLGIAQGKAPYVCCLDADDAIEPLFLEACLGGLNQDKDISIAYTGLKWILPTGKEGEGAWPGPYDYERQLLGHNQVPTCCVFTREMWERLGGYRRRYCPHGAGSEDAEFWLRAGAYGYKGKKVTDAQLFIYSFMSGGVSGNPEYTEVDWRAAHPWAKDARHPFASVAKPKRHSHPVHQYDRPVISVIIPVGKKHGDMVFDALDSLESQTYRDWEAIIVNDTGASADTWMADGFPNAMSAYPYARMISTTGGKGAGYARNRGVEIARAPLLLFLDADDVLTEKALEEMVISWGLYEEIVYSNYAGKAFMSQESLSNYDKRDILYYDSKTQLAVIRHHAAEFDCEQAVREPSRKLYIWNLITSLVPKAWHNEIGGFDESMISWEDWDYWIRMAQAGKCFHKLDKDLVVYRFYTGTRREDGLNEHQSLIKYMREKYDRTKPKESAMMSPPCGGGCGGKKKTIAQTSPPRVSAVPRQIITKQNREVNATMLNPQKVQDDEFVLCVYASRNLGQHKVIGMAEPRINYGQRKGGDKFYVRRRDIALQPHLFKVIEDVIKVPESQPSAIPEAPQLMEAPKPPPPSPHIIENVITDLQGVPGITPAIRAQLNATGVHTVDDLLCAGVGGLVELKGVGEKRAETIINFAKQYIEKHAEKPEEKGDEDA